MQSSVKSKKEKKVKIILLPKANLLITALLQSFSHPLSIMPLILAWSKSRHNFVELGWGVDEGSM